MVVQYAILVEPFKGMVQCMKKHSVLALSYGSVGPMSQQKATIINLGG